MELILTMAIFSIVMLAIILMMRTSLVSYKDGLFETQMQEEAQIVLNQVSDYLVDAVSVSKSGDEYTIEDVNGTKILAYNPDEHSLSYGGTLLSNSVDAFSISGVLNESTNYDSTARISITVSHQGRTYTSDKDVYFRNKSVETPDLYSLDGKETIKIGDGDENTKVVTVFRYGRLDLTKDYEVVKLKSANSTAAANYVYKVGSSNTEYSLGDLSHSDVSGKKAADGAGIIIEPNQTKRFDDNGIPEGSEIVGITRGGKELTFKLSTDDIAFNPSGTDVFQNHWDYNLSGTGYVTYIPVKGIDIYKAIASNEVDVKYTINLKKTSVNGADFTTGEKTISQAFADKGSNGGEEVGTDQSLGGGGPRRSLKARVKLLSDQYSEGMMITTPSDQGKNDEAGELYSGAIDGDQFLTFHIMIKKKGTSTVIYEQDVKYKYTYVGKDLTKLN